MRHKPEDHKPRKDIVVSKGNELTQTPKANVEVTVAEFLERDERLQLYDGQDHPRLMSKIIAVIMRMITKIGLKAIMTLVPHLRFFLE